MIEQFFNDLKSRSEFDQALDISSYTRMMGFHLSRKDEMLMTSMKYSEELIGSPFPKALHGGTVASLLEVSSLMEMIWSMNMPEGGFFIPKTIDITIDYLRSGKPEDTFAKASIYRQGRRFATVHAKAWQSERQKPIATAMVHFQIVE